MIVEFLPQARAELMDAVDYYEAELDGLGQRFWDEVDRHIAWIADNAEIPPLRDGGYRRVNLRVFPYYIAYIIRDLTIWILSVAHGNRLPEYWIDRA
jgi:plasmid stabilization system protein ParE